MLLELLLNLFAFGAADARQFNLQQVEIITPQSTIHLVRQADGWALEQPLNAKADATGSASSAAVTRGLQFPIRPYRIAKASANRPPKAML